MKNSGKHVAVWWRLSALGLAMVLAFAPENAQANGTAPSVVAGQAGFVTSGGTLSITNSPGAIINWQGFSIGAGETTRFIQQNSASSVLNRVIGSDPSVILGTLTSNGRIFLINPSGILFGQGARLDMSALVASTLNMSNQDFLAGRLNFTPNSLAGRLENRGSITTPSGGNVYLVGSNVSNSGIINSPKGEVILAAGNSVKIFDSSTPGVRVEIIASDNTAVNLGEILAQSGKIGIYGAALLNSGMLNADQVGRDASGKIVLRAKQDVTLAASSRLSVSGEQGGAITIQSESGTTLVSGSIEASGNGIGQTGGAVQVLGDKVALLGGLINVSGESAGGTVLIGGDLHGANPLVQNASATYMSANSSITADATTKGNGGEIVLWANNSMRAYGSTMARGGAQGGDGGTIETSGHWLDVAGIKVNAGASTSSGKSGIWLLDPADVTITSSTSGGAFGGGNPDVFSPSTGVSIANVDVSTIETALNAGTNITINTANTGTSGGGNGDITVGAAMTWTPTSPAILTLNAVRDVNMNAAITATNGSLIANAGNDVNLNMAITTTNGNLTANAGNNVNVRAGITMTTGNLALRAGGNGAGLAGGTVIFPSPGTITLNAGTTASIYYNPPSYASPTDYTGYFTGAGASTLNTYMWVYAQGSNKVYDGNNAAILAFVGAPTDAGVVSLVPGNATFSDKNAANGKTITYAGFGLGGADANKFALFSGAGTTLANITQAPVTLTAPVVSKVYNGDTAYTPVAGDLTALSTPLVAGDSVVAATITYADKNAGSGNKTVNLNAATIDDGNNGANYMVTLAGNNTSTITPLALTGLIASGNSIYGAALIAGAASFSNVVAGDVVTPAAVSVNIAGLTSTSGHLIAGSHSGIQSVSGTLGGADAANYTFAGATGDYLVTQLALTGAAINSVTTNYGTPAATGTATFSNIQTGGSTDQVTSAVNINSPVFSSSNHLNANSYTQSASSALSGADAANYSFGGFTATANYTVSPLNTLISGTRIYDGSLMAVATSLATVNSLVTGDVVTVSGSGTLADKNVAVNKVVTLGTLTLGGADAGNYQLVSGNLTVTAAPLTVTASAASKTYGQTAVLSTTGFTSSGLQSGDAIDSVTETSSGLAATASVSGSPYNITPSAATGSSFSAGNYTINYVDGALTVGRAPLSVTAISVGKTYNGLAYNGGDGYLYSGFVNGENLTVLGGTPTYSGTAQGAINKGSYVITPSGQTSGNYDITYSNGMLTVNPALLTVSSKSAGKIYDGLAYSGGNGVNYSGFVHGETSAVLTGAPSYSGDSQNAINAGAYVITPGGLSSVNSNYNFSYLDGALTVNRALLSVVASNVTKTYGQIPTLSAFTATGQQNGESVTSVTESSAGTAGNANVASYAITPSAATGTFNPLNYNISYVNGRLTVTPATLTLTASNATKTYGQTAGLAATAFISAGLMNSETVVAVAETSPGTVASASVAGGPYGIAITPGSATGTYSPSNYTISYVNGTLAVTPASLTITASNAGKTYGQTPTLSAFTNTPLQNSESIGSVTMTSSGTVGNSSVASYPVVPSAATGGTFNAGNYDITYVNGTLMVNTAPLVITASNATKLYGQTPTLSSFTSGGLQNGETIGSVTESSSGTLANASVTGSPYAIAITPGSATSGTFSPSNYTISYVNGALTVTPAVLSITANAFSKSYDGAAYNGGNGVVYNGFVNSEDATFLGGTLTYGGSAQGAVNAGGYAISPSGLTSSNYTISNFDGLLTVGKIPLSITANAAGKPYDGLAYSGGNGVSYSGFVNGEATKNVLTGTLVYGGSSQNAVNAGGYVISPSGLTSANYIISNFEGALTVNKIPLAVSANALVKTYDGLTYSGGNGVIYSGFVNGEASNTALNGSLAYTGSAQGALNVGSYTITPGGLISGNYNISYFDNALTVNPALLSVIANATSKAFGTANPKFTFTLNGFVNGENAISAGVTGLAALGTVATDFTPAGSAIITAKAGSLAAGNYVFSNLVDGTLTITPVALPLNPAPPSVIVNPQDAPYFHIANGITDVIPGFTALFTGNKQSVIGEGNHISNDDPLYIENISPPAQPVCIFDTNKIEVAPTDASACQFDKHTSSQLHHHE